MSEQYDTSNITVDHLDELIENSPVPADIVDRFPPFANRFVTKSRIYGRLLLIKRFYQHNEAVEQRFSTQRKRHMSSPSTSNNSFYRRGFEKAFGEIDFENNKYFNFGNVGRFLDLGCSPGGFSNWLLDHNKEARGVGVTLPDADAKFKLATDDSYLTGPRYKVLYSDLTALAMDAASASRNPAVALDGTVNQTDDHAEDGHQYDLVIAGAFPTLEGQLPWWLRAQLIFSQLLIVLSNLQGGGSAIFVINTKVFRWLVEVLRILRLSFENVTSVKCTTLHTNRSSCYVVCRRFKMEMQQVTQHTQLLRNVLHDLNDISIEWQVQPSGLESGNTGKGSPDSTSASERDMPSLFPDLDDEKLFEDENQFVLGLFEPAWAKQYNAIHDDLAQIMEPQSPIPWSAGASPTRQAFHDHTASKWSPQSQRSYSFTTNTNSGGGNWRNNTSSSPTTSTPQGNQNNIWPRKSRSKSTAAETSSWWRSKC